MVDRIELVQNDRGPQLLLTLEDSFTGKPMDLSKPGIEIQMNFVEASTGDLKAVINLFPGPNAKFGQCMLDWPNGSLDSFGSFIGEVQITHPSGVVETTPEKIKFKVRKELG